MDLIPPTPAPLISAVILAYNSAAHLEACLSSLARSNQPSFEVIVVDNASRDNSTGLATDLLARLQLSGSVHPLPKNLGCAGGNNVGWRKARGEYIVFLNPDTELQPDTIPELVRPLEEDATIGVTGAKMYFPNSRMIQHAGGIIHPNGMTDHFGARQEDQGQCDEPREVAYVTGAGMAMRRTTLEQLGGFDESYFPAYYEEVDLCTRVRKLGLRVVYIPAAVMVHHESVSLGSDSPALRRLYPRMRIRYLLKNVGVRDLLRHSLPFEIRWMLREPAARGYRLQQFVAYAANLHLLVGKLLGINRINLNR